MRVRDDTPYDNGQCTEQQTAKKETKGINEAATDSTQSNKPNGFQLYGTTNRIQSLRRRNKQTTAQKAKKQILFFIFFFLEHKLCGTTNAIKNGKI